MIVNIIEAEVVLVHFPRLLDLRQDSDKTQKEIAAVLGIDQRVYSNYETGKRIPDIDMLIRIADIYEVTLEQLLTQTCTKTGIINETSGPYFTSRIIASGDTVYLTEEELELISNYRSAGEDERKLTRKVLGM